MESSQSENSVRQISQANHLLQSESDAQDKGIKSIYQIIKPRKQNKLVFILKTDRRSIKIIWWTKKSNRKNTHLMNLKSNRKNTQEYLIHKTTKTTQVKPITPITEIHSSLWKESTKQVKINHPTWKKEDEEASKK